MVYDLDAIRVALGETKLTFHGSSYGTLLGDQYAEVYPQRVRAVVLESVVDHGLGTRDFLDTQASTAQDSFDKFAKWCDSSTSCSLHGRDIRGLWADLLARAGRGALPDPQQPHVALTPFTLSYAAFRTFYEPEWPKLAGVLKQLDESKPPVVVPPPTPTGLRSLPRVTHSRGQPATPVKGSERQYAAAAGELDPRPGRRLQLGHRRRPAARQRRRAAHLRRLGPRQLQLKPLYADRDRQLPDLPGRPEARN